MLLLSVSAVVAGMLALLAVFVWSPALSWQAWFTMYFLQLLLVLVLVRDWDYPAFIFWTGAPLLLLLGILNYQQATAGFSDKNTILLGAMFIVAKAVEQTGVLQSLLAVLLGRPTSPQRLRAGVLRGMLFTAAVSVFVYDVPLIAVLVPAALHWCRQFSVPPSRLLLPLSFATILGGLCSKIGTSDTTFVSLMIHYWDANWHLAMFELLPVAAPAGLVALLLTWLLSWWLLPVRSQHDANTTTANKRTFCSIYELDAALVGARLADTGLLQLTDAALLSVQHHDGEQLHTDQPGEYALQPGDRLAFAASLDATFVLHRFNGVHPCSRQLARLLTPRARRACFVAIIGRHSPLCGHTAAQSSYFADRDAAILAIATDSAELVEPPPGTLSQLPVQTLTILPPTFNESSALLSSSSFNSTSSTLQSNSSIHNQSTNQSINNQSINNQSINNQSINNQSINQSIDNRSLQSNSSSGLNQSYSSFAGGHNNFVSSLPTFATLPPAQIGCDDVPGATLPMEDVVLGAGMVVLFEAGRDFADELDDRHFYSVQRCLDESLAAPEKLSWRSVLLWLGFVAIVVIEGVWPNSIYGTSILLGSLSVCIGVITWQQGLSAVRGDVLLLVAASFCIGNAVNDTNLAATVAFWIYNVFHALFGRFGAIWGLFLFGSCLSAVLPNPLMATIVWPIAETIASLTGIGTRPLAITTILCISASFIVPLGSPANLIVVKPAGYQFGDFAVIGSIVTIVYSLLCSALIYLIYLT